MVGNLDLHYHVPLADPATIIKKAINTIKKELQESLENLKTALVLPSLADAQRAVAEAEVALQTVTDNLTLHRTKKPKRDRAAEAGLKEQQKDPSTGITGKADAAQQRALALAVYAQEMLLWTTTLAELVESKVVHTADLYAKQIKASVLYKISVNQDTGTGNLDPVVVTIEKTQEGIDETFEELNTAVDSIDIMLKPLPVVTEPYSANFLFTLKNPKPITQIADSLDETVDQSYLDGVTERFDLNKDALMSSQFATLLSSSVIAQSAYTAVLDLAKLPLSPQASFPAYKELLPTNVAWYTNFLLPKWAPTGGAQYGFPGFPAYPIPV